MIDSTANSRFSDKQLIIIYTIISLQSGSWRPDLPAHPCFFLLPARCWQPFVKAL